MSSQRLPVDPDGPTPLVPRPWAHLSNNELLDRLEWTYGENGNFEPDVVWELARRAQAQ